MFQLAVDVYKNLGSFVYHLCDVLVLKSCFRVCKASVCLSVHVHNCAVMRNSVVI